MKVLYLITKSNWGGAQRHMYDLALAMKERGYEVRAAAGGAGVLKERLEAAGIFTHSVIDMARDISIRKDAGSLRAIWNIIRNERPDILHLHSPKAAGLGALCGRLLRVKKIVLTVHGWTWNEERPFFERLWIIFFSWITALLCHKVIVISRHDHDQALKLPGMASRLVLIPLVIQPATLVSIDGAKQFMARKIGVTPAELGKSTVIGTIAELHRNKGLSYLIEAMEEVAASHPTALCIVIGEGEEQARLQDLIAQKGLERHVFLVGTVDHAAEYLKAFSIFTLPSLKEGLPITLLEAGMAGLPVVSTTVGGIPDIIHDAQSGLLIQPKNSRELGHALLFMIEHPEERRKYGAALHDKVARDFSFGQMLAKIEAIYTA